MVRFCTYVCFSVLVILYPGDSICQSYTLNVTRYSPKDGLSNRRVNDIVKDSDGNTWFLTKYGLNKYDGLDFSHYFVETTWNKAHVDHNKNIWFFSMEKAQHAGKHYWFRFTSYDEIKIYLDADDSFVSIAQYLDLPSLSPHDIAFVSVNDYILLLLKDGTIYKYEKNTLEQIPYSYTPKSYPHSIYPHSSDTFWEVYLREVSLVNYDGTRQLLYQANRNILANVYRDSALHWIQDRPNHVGSSFFYCRMNGEGEIDTSTLTSIERERIFYTDELLFDTMWFDTHTGLVNAEKMQFLLTDDESQIVGLDMPNNFERVFSVYDEGNRNFWIGTHFGAYYVSIEAPLFKTLLVSDSADIGIRGMTSHEGTLFVSSHSGHFTVEDYQGIPKIRVLEPKFVGSGVCNCADGSILMANSQRGLKRFKNNALDELVGWQKASIKDCYQDTITRTIWVATSQYFGYYDSSSDATVPVIEQFPTRHIQEIDGQLWLFGRNGIIVFDPVDQEILRRYTSLSDLPIKRVTSVHMDKDSTFWIGMRGLGLVHWDPVENSAKRYTTHDGLPNTVIHAIYGNAKNQLWIATENGLVLYDKVSESIRVLTTNDGLPHNEFNEYAHFLDRDSTLFLGTMNGVVYFDINSGIESTYGPKLRLLKTLQFDKNNPDPINITKQTLKSNFINIDPKIRNTQLQFVLEDFSIKNGVIYAFKIEPRDLDWTYQQRSIIDIANLAYGEHTLRVKGHGRKGTWSEEQSIVIQVPRPWYQQASFLALATISVFLMAYLFVLLRLRRIEKEKSALERAVAQRTQELELSNKIKDKFYGIIAHDLRTPMASLSGLATKAKFLIKNKRSQELEKLAQAIDSSIHRANNLLDNLLKWARLQQNTFPHHPQKMRLCNVVKEVFDLFTEVAVSRNIDLRDETDPSAIFYADKNAVVTVVRNLVDNAIKNSPSHNSVVLQSSTDDQYTQLFIRDHGCGIRKKTVIEQFNSCDTGALLNSEGLGIALSIDLIRRNGGSLRIMETSPKGTTVLVSIPRSSINPPNDL